MLGQGNTKANNTRSRLCSDITNAFCLTQELKRLFKIGSQIISLGRGYRMGKWRIMNCKIPIFKGKTNKDLLTQIQKTENIGP